MNTAETNGKTENLNQEINDIEKNQMENLELKNTLTNIKTSLMRLIAEGRQ